MGKVYEAITPTIREFVQKQHMFFVATAPLSAEGVVNLSPKGLDSLRIVDEKTVVYADLTGSGVETVAHLKENGRIVLMFCAMDGPPKIVRFHGVGEVIEPVNPDFAELQSEFPEYVSLRSFIRIRCVRISDSCGWGVPRFEFKGNRSQLLDWGEKQGREGVANYQRGNNLTSLDGLPGLQQT